MGCIELLERSPWLANMSLVDKPREKANYLGSNVLQCKFCNHFLNLCLQSFGIYQQGMFWEHQSLVGNMTLEGK